MNLLIIYTHPNHNSLNYSFLQKVLEGIEVNTKDVVTKTIDLYEENFNPSLVFNQEKQRRNMHIDPEVENYRQLISWAKHIVFIYPIWWGRPPAMLLGFFDRVFASGFAYEYKKSTPFSDGLLKGKEVTCISTMKGPNNYPRFFLNNSHQVLMRRGIFNYVGIKKVKFFEFGNVEKKQGNHNKYFAKVESYFQSI